MPSLAIVVVNYNTRDLLAACLSSVYASRCEHAYHVFVVDNRSTDGSAAMVAERFPQATLIASDRNGGFGYANNLALRYLASQSECPVEQARGARLTMIGPRHGAQPQSEVPATGSSTFRFPCDYVLFLNPDTVLSADALQATVDFLEKHTEAAVVGPKVIKPDGTLDLACRRSFPTPTSGLFKLAGLSRLFPKSRLLAKYNLTYLSDDETAEVDSVMGAYMLVRSETLAQAGLFDERFFMYGEDLDLAFRIKERGWKVFYYPAVEVLHHKGAASRKQSERSIREFYRAMHIFYRKHYAGRNIGPINAVVSLGITLRGWIALAQNALRPTERKRVT
ncbi:MAG TPA: glycosyltransferase family 2 protein [Chloroflexia bacterium]|nr:glycosyltransferase family 2 protein [Chloroflexia bacterium]